MEHLGAGAVHADGSGNQVHVPGIENPGAAAASNQAVRAGRFGVFTVNLNLFQDLLTADSNSTRPLMFSI